MIVPFFLLFFMIGCGGSPDKPVRPQAAPTEPAGTVTNETLPSADFHLQPQPEPGVYELAIEWDAANLLVDEVWIEKATKTKPREYLHRSQLSQGTYQDKELRYGENYDYQVFAISDGRTFPLGAMSLSLPEDWVVPEGEQAWVQRPLGRLFLSKGSVIRLEGNDLSLELLELHSEGGTIETFRAGETASEANAGRSGGRIHIKAGLAVGNLTLASRGESGGPGTCGQNGNPGAPGSNVPPVFSLLDGRMVMTARVSISKEKPRKFVLERLPATDGQNGEPGSPGTNGASGGASGGIRLEVERAESFLPVIVSQGGAGGTGGRGGAGGAGGEGGLVTDLPPSPHPLMGGRKGAEGAPGSDGTVGEKGTDGPIEVILGGKKVI